MKMPERMEVLDRVNRKTLLKMIIKEGRNRQIRKIATLLAHPVQDLQRISISNRNSNDLQEGKWLKTSISNRNSNDLQEGKWLKTKK